MRISRRNLLVVGATTLAARVGTLGAIGGPVYLLSRPLADHPAAARLRRQAASHGGTADPMDLLSLPGFAAARAGLARPRGVRIEALLTDADVLVIESLLMGQAAWRLILRRVGGPAVRLTAIL